MTEPSLVGVLFIQMISLAIVPHEARLVFLPGKSCGVESEIQILTQLPQDWDEVFDAECTAIEAHGKLPIPLKIEEFQVFASEYLWCALFKKPN